MTTTHDAAEELGKSIAKMLLSEKYDGFSDEERKWIAVACTHVAIRILEDHEEDQTE